MVEVAGVILEPPVVRLSPDLVEHYHRRTVVQERIVMGRRVLDYACSICGVAL